MAEKWSEVDLKSCYNFLNNNWRRKEKRMGIDNQYGLFIMKQIYNIKFSYSILKSFVKDSLGKTSLEISGSYEFLGN